MSDLADLEDIVGGEVFTGPHARWAQPFGETCKAGHPWTDATTRWQRNGNRYQRQCRECQRVRTGFKGIYRPRKSRNQP